MYSVRNSVLSLSCALVTFFFFLPLCDVMLLGEIHTVQTASARLVHAPCHRHRFLPGLTTLLTAVGLVAHYSHGALPVALVQVVGRGGSLTICIMIDRMIFT